MNWAKQSKRKIQFHHENYNPGPGYYVKSNVPHYSEVYKTSFPDNPNFDHLIKDCNWSQDKRMKGARSGKKGQPGPGHYFGVNSWVKKGKKQVNRVMKVENTLERYNAIPSIPAQQQCFGYEETKDGFLVLATGQEDFGQEATKVGPGKYNPSFKQIHQRVKGYDMSKGLGRKAPPKKSRVPKKVLVGPGDYDPVDSIPNTFGHMQKKETEEGTLHKKIQNRKKQIRTEVEKNRIVKKKGPKMKHPPPGQYYDEAKWSSFKLSYKPQEFQCFDIGQVRFADKNDDNEVGPGNYKIDRDSVIKAGGGLMARAPRFAEVGGFHTKMPGPGTYNFRSKKKMRSSQNIKFAPVFGSTSKRFQGKGGRPDSGPCIGMYRPQKSDFRNKYKNKRKIKISFDQILKKQRSGKSKNNQIKAMAKTKQANTLIDRLSKLMNIEKQMPNKNDFDRIEDLQARGLTDFEDDRQKLNQFMRQSQRAKGGLSSFVSKVPKFQDNSKKITYNVAPGQYDTRTANFQPSTHNAKASFMGKERRMGPKVKGRNGGTDNFLGPNAYYPSMKLTKQSLAREITF